MAMIDESGRSYVPDHMGAHTYIGDHVCVGDDEHVVIDLAQVEREGRRFLGVLVESGRSFCSGEFVRVGRATPLPPTARPRPVAARSWLDPPEREPRPVVALRERELDCALGCDTCLPAGAPGSRFPHVCPRCGAPAYVGFSHVDCARRHKDLPTCEPVREPEPAIVEEVTLTNYPGKRTITTGAPAPGLEGAERIWRARDVHEYPGPESCLHPTREGAIAAWQARLAARKAAAK